MDIDGTPQADSLDDTAGNDTIDAGAGDDEIAVTDGHDEVDGGPGDDELSIYWADSTSSIVNGVAPGGFSIRLVGGPARSVNVANVERIFIEAGSGNDNFTTGSGDDRIWDGPRDDSFNLATGDDVLAGGAGGDAIYVATGHDSVDGGPGTDTAVLNWRASTDPVVAGTPLPGFQYRFESGSGRSADLVGIERVWIEGGSANDVIIGFSFNDRLSDGLGSTFDNDILRGAGGADLLGVSAGHDVLDGGVGIDSATLTWKNSSAPIVMGVVPAGYDIRFESGTDYSANMVGIEDISIIGGSGNDVIVTGNGDDRFLDSETGASGDDYFEAGAGSDYHDIRTGHDRSDGGADFDNASINWSDSLVPVIAATPTAGYEIRFESGGARSADLRNIEAVTLYAGSADDNIAMGDSHDIVYANIGNDIIDGGDGDDSLDGEDGADVLAGGAGFDNLYGGSGDDTLRGGGDDDYLDAESGNDQLNGDEGDDTLYGGDGNDVLIAGSGIDALNGDGGNDGFYFGASMTAADGADGGTGTDSLAIQGNYPGLTLGSVVNIDALVLFSGANTSFGDNANNRYDYNVTLTDANLAAGQTLIVQGKDLLPGEDLVLNASAETSGHFRMFAGQGTDTLTGGSGNDGFFFGADGNYTAADRVHGGPGLDSIGLRGNYNGAQAIVFDAAGFTGIDAIVVLSGHTREYGGPLAPGGFDYDLTMANGNVLAGQLMQIIGSTLGADESFRFDGRAETDGSFRILAGAGTDTLFGSSNADIVYGGLNADALDGGAGSDTYLYRSALESTSAATDSLVLGDGDRIDLSTIDATPADGNQAFTFIGAQAFGSVAGELRAYQSGGGLWIVEGDVDGNAVADLVINVTSADALVVGDFIP